MHSFESSDGVLALQKAESQADKAPSGMVNAAGTLERLEPLYQISIDIRERLLRIRVSARADVTRHRQARRRRGGQHAQRAGPQRG